MNTAKQQIIEAIEKGQLYDYIANNYWNMSKELLKDVLLEVIWLCGGDEEILGIELASNLSERWGD